MEGWAEGTLKEGDIVTFDVTPPSFVPGDRFIVTRFEDGLTLKLLPNLRPAVGQGKPECAAIIPGEVTHG